MTTSSSRPRENDAVADAAPRPDVPTTRLKHRHLLGIADLSPEEIVLILDTATAMQEIAHRPIKKVPTLRGRTVVNLFFEPSTRTRTSFEVAEKRLSADTLNVAIATSSVVKGETLVDTALNLEAMSPDMIVMRHASLGRVSPAVAHLQVARSSTPATACTSIRRRRCSTRSRSASTRAGCAGSRSPSSATCCTAGCCGRTCCC